MILNYNSGIPQQERVIIIDDRGSRWVNICHSKKQFLKHFHKLKHKQYNKQSFTKPAAKPRQEYRRVALVDTILLIWRAAAETITHKDSRNKDHTGFLGFWAYRFCIRPGAPVIIHDWFRRSRKATGTITKRYKKTACIEYILNYDPFKKKYTGSRMRAPRHSNRCFTKPNMRRKHQPSTAGGYNGNGYTRLFRIAIRDYVFFLRTWFLYR